MPFSQQTCPICASSRRRDELTMSTWSGVNWHSVRCRACGHRYVDPMPDDAEIAAMYDDAYFDDGGGWVCGYWPGSYAENEANLRAEAREALRLLPGASGRLLEVGCAGGFFLDEARRVGWTVRGVELNRAMADHAWSLGIPVTCAPIERANLSANAFDVVIAQDVVEHLRDPHIFMDAATTALAPGGALIIRGPLEQSGRAEIFRALRRLRGGRTVGDEPPFHLHGFTRQSFHRLMAAHGLEVESWRAICGSYPVDKWNAQRVAEKIVEVTGNAIDRVTGGGVFMEATARLNGRAL